MGGFWLAYRTETNNHEMLDRFAREAMMACRRRLPEGRLTGVLKGRENDIRQDAIEMLFERYLRGNKALAVATDARDAESVERSLNASIVACVFFSLRRHTRKACAEAANHVPIHTVIPPPSCPPILENPETRAANEATLKSRTLVNALNAGSITPRNYRIAAMAIDHGVPVKRIAEIEGVSLSAIYQQLRRIGPALREAKRRLESM